MNKKILVGSILSVVILILVSFTSVVGYNSIESDKKLSPLFNIRSKRALKIDNQDFTCEYIGKGDRNILYFPIRDSNMVLIQDVIDRISKMDENEIKRWRDFFNRARMRNIFHKEDIAKIEDILQDFTINQKFVKDNIINYGGFQYTWGEKWIPGCALIDLLLYIEFIIFISLFLLFLFVTARYGCTYTIDISCQVCP